MSLLRRLLHRVLSGRAVVLPSGPIPSTWEEALPRWVPLSRRLAEDDRVRLLRLTQLFLRDVPVEGAGGLVLTEQIRVTIGATASLLLLNLPYPRFPKLRRVLVYPDTFVPVRLHSWHSQAIPEPVTARLGEASRDGMVVLSWADIQAGSHNAGDGRNVVLHEFAHVLDFEDGLSDGSPVLETAHARTTWNTVVRRELARLQGALERDEDTALDPYAATNRAEFFAVATETFFEQGARLRALLPELYDQLRQFYRQDPAAGFDDA